MTYRSGQRRDSPRNSGNYGGGNNSGGNRRQNYGSGNQVNPWQGGITPGGNQLGGLGLLPRPAQSGVLSNLTSPEAQLAMATNLLNKILSPQQNQTANVPSLLSLPMNGNLSYGDYNSRGSYADRHRDRPGDRRMQPYNKSGLNRRGDAKSRLGKPRISDKPSSSAKPKKRDSDDKDGEKQNGDASEDNEKRGDDDKKEDDDDEEKVLGAKYSVVPNALLTCHVCRKNMWDSCSFEKHISGRRHQMMMEKLDETYKIKVEVLRHEQRSAESQRELEIERLERQGKKIFNNKREYCTMCDLHFYGNLISHRKKDRHQKLKSFLHPKCHLCHKEFPNRLEWDDHKLSVEHMLKLSEYFQTTRPGIKEEDMDVNDVESLDGGDISVFDVLVEDLNKEKKKLNVNIDDFPTSVEDYDIKAPLGVEYVSEVQGHLCKLCNKFISSSEEAAVHALTLSHYKNYAGVVKMKVKAEKEKEVAERAAELKAKRESFNKKRGKKDGDEEDEKDEVKMEDGEDNAAEETEEPAAPEPVAVKEEPANEKMEVDAAAEEKVEEDVEEEVLTRGRGKATRGRGKARRGGK